MAVLIRDISMLVFLWVLCYLFISGDSKNGLEPHFYRNKCPNAELIVKREMQKSMLVDPTAAASILRVSFHDCQVDGCDASVLLKGKTAETLSDRNFALRKLNVIHGIKKSLEAVCPQTVSCADIIQLAGRETIAQVLPCIQNIKVVKLFIEHNFAVFSQTGGPRIEILTGRRDALSAHTESAETQLPEGDISIDEFIHVFSHKNITLEEGVALLGAHTLGVVHCRNIEKRLQTRDPTLSPSYSVMLKMMCSNPAAMSDKVFMANDVTNFFFDNRYFIDILQGRGLLQIDSEISIDKRTRPYVVAFANNQKLFFDRFTSGFRQLSLYKVLVGEEGEIRKDCRFVNNKHV